MVLVLAITDLADSILLFTSGLFRGALWHMDHYASYDALIIVPLSGAFSCWNVIATVCVALGKLPNIKKKTLLYTTILEMSKMVKQF